MFTILAASYGTVSDIEIAWTIVALVGVVFDAYNLRESRKDLQAAKQINGSQEGRARRTLARSHMVSSALRLYVLAIALAIGCVAMTINDPPPNTHLERRIEVFSILVKWGLISIIVAICVKAILEFLERRRIREISYEFRTGREDPHDISKAT